MIGCTEVPKSIIEYPLIPSSSSLHHVRHKSYIANSNRWNHHSILWFDTSISHNHRLFHDTAPPHPPPTQAPPHPTLLLRRRTKTAIHVTTTTWHTSWTYLVSDIWIYTHDVYCCLSFVWCWSVSSSFFFFFRLCTPVADDRVLYEIMRRGFWWWLLPLPMFSIPKLLMLPYIPHKGWWISIYQHTRLIGYRFFTSSSQSLSSFLLSRQILLFMWTKKSRLSNSCCRWNKGEEREINKFKIFS